MYIPGYIYKLDIYIQVVFIVDPMNHHSLVLPFRELTKRLHYSSPIDTHTHTYTHTHTPEIIENNCNITLSYHIKEININKETGTLDLYSLRDCLYECYTLANESNDYSDNNSNNINYLEVLPVCLFTSVSNITGMNNNTKNITAIAHAWGALVCWDFAATAAHSVIDINPKECRNNNTLDILPDLLPPHDFFASLSPYSGPLNVMVRHVSLSPRVDVAFLSPHKLLGGPGTPGILVIKKFLLTHRVPANPGGGTVSFVSNECHSYIDNVEEREESGTPDIIGSIKTGLICRIHASIGLNEMIQWENYLANILLDAWQSNPCIFIPGPLCAKLKYCCESVDNTLRPGRVGIISFMIKISKIDTHTQTYIKNQVIKHTHTNTHTYTHKTPLGEDIYLHHNLITTILNDFFGIQARGGCACAAPYLFKLINVSSSDASRYSDAILLEGLDVLKPGVCRVGVHFTMNKELIEILRDAVLWISDNSNWLLTQYTFLLETGRWTHRAYTAMRGFCAQLLYGDNYEYLPEYTDKETYTEILKHSKENEEKDICGRVNLNMLTHTGLLQMLNTPSHTNIYTLGPRTTWSNPDRHKDTERMRQSDCCLSGCYITDNSNNDNANNISNISKNISDNVPRTKDELFSFAEEIKKYSFSYEFRKKKKNGCPSQKFRHVLII
eukprot:GHVR01048647.1.p1 GENE.GHVR01048647.1~~GHVR01048647.1.p1  ORF type:complete len:670 (+),score=170.85 GHVR01048647.1:924-2933(+)